MTAIRLEGLQKSFNKGAPILSELTLSVATDGTAGHVRAVLDELDPTRQAIDRFAVHSATLDDVFLALTGHTTKETAGV